MNSSGKEDTEFTIKVPKGTIIKVEGHPVKLKESLYIRQVDDETFKIENHVVMDTEEEEE